MLPPRSWHELPGGVPGTGSLRRRRHNPGPDLGGPCARGGVLAIGLSSSITATHVVPPGSGAWHLSIVRSCWHHADLFTLGMAPAVLRVNFEDGPCWLPAWWRKASAAGLVGVTVLTVLLTDRERIVQYQGAVAYETLACALLLALVVLPAT